MNYAASDQTSTSPEQTYFAPYPYPVSPAPAPCPGCGYCPTCGRHRPVPISPYPWRWPYSFPQRITWGAGSTSPNTPLPGTYAFNAGYA